MPPALNIHLPVFQKFDCHACGYCCRNLVVNVTPTERRRILEAGWGERLPDQPLFITYRFRRQKLHRIAHRADGACVFLGEDGRCRLHAETGVHSKPLACRLYPFVPTPGAGSVRIDLRADCPSVAANRGRSLNVHQKEIAGLVQETVTRPMSAAPEWLGGRQLTIQEFEALTAGFLKILDRASLCYRDRLRAGCILLDLLYAAKIGKVRDERFVELMDLLVEAVLDEVTEPGGAAPVLPVRAGRLFRQWLFLHAVADDPADLAAGRVTKMRRSWRRYQQARRFADETGPLPPVRANWPQTTFEVLTQVQPAEDRHLEPLIRSMGVKLDTHAFCGPGYYRRDALTGLTALWLLPALVGWFARLTAVAARRDAIASEDLLAGVRQAHHTFGVSPVFTRISERMRLHAFARPGIPAAILARYGA